MKPSLRKLKDFETGAMVRASLTYNPMPRNASSPDNVTTKDGTATITTQKPCHAAISTPARTVIMTVGSVATPRLA